MLSNKVRNKSGARLNRSRCFLNKVTDGTKLNGRVAEKIRSVKGSQKPNGLLHPELLSGK